MVDHLFDLADKILKKRGRLVYLYPIEKEKGYNLEELPKRENFKLLECSENYLNSKAGRLLLTYIKI